MIGSASSEQPADDRKPFPFRLGSESMALAGGPVRFVCEPDDVGNSVPKPLLCGSELWRQGNNLRVRVQPPRHKSVPAIGALCLGAVSRNRGYGGFSAPSDAVCC